jgi:probable F420-dependent oxidoreductase
MSISRASLQAYWMPAGWYAPVALEAERAGFAAFWIGDHIAAPIDYSSTYLYATTGRSPMSDRTPLIDTFAALASAAAVTSRIRVGTNVLVLPMRPPLITARAAATVQDLSGGRFLLGVGVGWPREEFEALGQPFDRRGARTDEILELLPRLWSGDPVQHSGMTCEFATLRLWPPVCAPIPLLGSGSSEAALRRSARLDGWCGPPAMSIEETIEVRDRLLSERRAAGLEDRPFDLWVRPGRSSVEEITSYRAAGFDQLVVIAGRGKVPESLNDACESVGTAAADLEIPAR